MLATPRTTRPKPTQAIGWGQVLTPHPLLADRGHGRWSWSYTDGIQCIDRDCRLPTLQKGIVTSVEDADPLPHGQSSGSPKGTLGLRFHIR